MKAIGECRLGIRDADSIASGVSWPLKLAKKVELQDGALALLDLRLRFPSWIQNGTFSHVSSSKLVLEECDSPNSLIEYRLQVSLCQSRALEVLDGLDLLGTVKGLLVCDGSHPLLGQATNRVGIFTEIELGANQDDGDIGSMVINFGVPLQSSVSLSHPPPNGTILR